MPRNGHFEGACPRGGGAGVLNTINPMGVDEFTIIVRRESFPGHAQVEEIPKRETFLYYFIIRDGRQVLGLQFYVLDICV